MTDHSTVLSEFSSQNSHVTDLVRFSWTWPSEADVSWTTHDLH